MTNANSHPRDVQQANARNPRSAHTRPSGKGQTHSPSITGVAADDAGGVSFSFHRAESGQCIKWTPYDVPPSSAEAQYFLPLARHAVLAAADACPQPIPLGDAITSAVRREEEEGGDASLRIEALQYGQLVPVRDPPPVSDRSPKVDDPTTLWQSFTAPITITDRGTEKTVTRHFVLSPHTTGRARVYEVKDTRSLQFAFELTLSANIDFDFTADGEPADGTVTYAVHLSFSKRGKANCYTDGMSLNENCIKVQFGEIDVLKKFSAWYTSPSDGSAALDCVMVADPALRRRIFDQKSWPRHVPEREEGDGDEGLDPLADRPKRIKPRYDFHIIDEETCTQVIDKKPSGGDEMSEPEYQHLANFNIPRIVALYQFRDGSHMPYWKVLVRRIWDPTGEGTVYLHADDVDRDPDCDGAYLLEVEVLIDLSLLNTQKDVVALFSDYHSSLLASHMTADHLRSILAQLPLPTPLSVITHFGRQRRNGLFAFGNCCFHDGRIYTHEEGGVALCPRFFEKSIMPLARKDYPQLLIIPQLHVRYVCGVNLWQNVMPRIFRNNLQQTKAIFAIAVAGLHVHRFWEGEHGVGHCFPITWVHSREHGTGKTEACLLANSVLGCDQRGLWAGDFYAATLFVKVPAAMSIAPAVPTVVAPMYNAFVTPLRSPASANDPSSSPARKLAAMYGERTATGIPELHFLGVFISS